MTNFIDEFNVRKELVEFLRNSDILTITERGVTTESDTGTFASDSSHLINDATVKNIRSISVAGAPLSLGLDYTTDMNFDDSGTKKCKFTFVVPQTGAFVISYDTGSDKIYPDFPRDDLHISSYPRIAVDTQDSTSDAFGIGGNDYITDMGVTVIGYAKTTQKIDDIITKTRTAIITNNQNFFYLRFIKPVGKGPIISDPEGKNEIFSRNVDFLSKFNVENII